MADYMDKEAIESDEEEAGGSAMEEDEEDDGGRRRPSANTAVKKKHKAVISSDEEEDEEDDDEEKAKEEMKGFIADDDDEEEDASDSDSGSDSDSEAESTRKKKKKRRRSRSRSRSDDLDEDDMELLQENLGMKIKKQRKRIKIDSGSEDEAEEGGDVDDLPDVDQAPSRLGDRDEGEEYDSDDYDNFIVGDDGQPIKRDRKKKKQSIFTDSGMQQAEELFGVAFEKEDFDQYGDEDYESEEDEDEEDLDEEEDPDRPSIKRGGRRRRRPKQTIFDVYEPKELELRHFTDFDNEVRNTDMPERMQLRDTPVSSVPEGSDELEREADWIYRHAFNKPPISKQDTMPRSSFTHWQRRDGIQEQIKEALDFMRQQFNEVPFIARYRKEYTPDLKIDDLWRIYEYDEQWCKLQNRKKKLKSLIEKMQVYQGDTIMKDPNAPLPEGTRILSTEDVEKVDAVDSFEEYKDRQQHFKLYYDKDIEDMLLMMRNKRDEPDSEEREVLKQAKRKDSYTLCRNFGLIGMSTRFGLTAEQFGENLHDGYQKYEVDQEPTEPMEVANEYTNDKFSSVEDVLMAAKLMVATQIARDPVVRQVTREAFYERACVTVKPTKKGKKEIDESHDCYAVKYLKDKPVRELVNDEWLRLTQAEEQKLVTIELGYNLRGVVSQTATFLEEAKELFKHDAYSKSVTEWNNLRRDIVDMAFNNMLFPMLRKELALKLTKEAKEGVTRSCRSKLFDWLKIGKYAVTFEDEDEDDWDSSQGCRVMGISYDSDFELASYAAALTADGEVAEYLKLEHILQRKNVPRREVEERMATLNALRSFIIRTRPHCIALGVTDRSAIGIQREIEEIVQGLVDGENQFPRIQVFLLDDNLAKVYANSQRAEQDFREYPNILRQAISIGRRMQDPLTEFSQLCGPENEILCLRYHPMQDLLSEEEILQGLFIEFINRTNEVGVDINQCVNHPHTSNLVQFIGGLGPRKGAALLKTLRQMHSAPSQKLENRQQLVTLCHMGPKVLINCAGFIKIDTSILGESEVYIEVLDGSRIHNEAYEWARKMAVDALEYDEEDGNPANALEEILKEPEKLAELDLDAFAQELERQGFGKKAITLQDIRDELHHMYKDLREPFSPPNPEEVFSMVTKETPNSFYIGKLVQAVVTGFAYKRPAEEELNQAAPIRKGESNLWQCPFCGQDDFPELTEVWNHFDADACPGKAVGVKVRLDNGVNGFIPMKYLSDSNVLNPGDRVRPGKNIFCRITKIMPERFSVECICKTSALEDKNYEYKPKKDDYYDFDAEQRDSVQEMEKRKQQQRQAYIKRVIVHPCFYNIAYKEAERLMANMDQGDVIIRPSSRGENRLTVTWKVADGIYQHVDVREEGKLNAFSLGKSLWIGTEEFEDLEEIIARYVNPMAAHARDILSFKYYRDTGGGKKERANELLIQEKRAHPGKIHYILSASKELPGKFLLSYMPRMNVRHEYVTVTPDGFRFRKQQFETLSSLFKWFKEHFRDPVPNTPATPGRLTNRTPHLTTPGAITPGAMSLPYTPSGRTPHLGVTPRAVHPATPLATPRGFPNGRAAL